MMFHWEPDMIRFMREASEQSDYNEQLTKTMLPYLDNSSSVCDAGCGLGYLSLALAGHVRDVTAVDVNENALRVLRENCQTRGIDNIRICCGEVEQLAPSTPYDAMVFCFFGRTEEILSIAKRQCRGKVFLMQKNYTKHRFSVGEHAQGSDTFPNTCEALRQRGIPFVKQELSLELGQPFRSLADARRFFELYSRDEDPTLITDEFLMGRLTRTGREDFPFYMPHQREVGWLMLEVKDLPEEG